MPLPETHDPAADVLEGHEPRASRMWRRRAAVLMQRRVPLLLVGGVLTVALVGGLAFLAAHERTSRTAQDETQAAIVDASGVMVVDMHRSTETDTPRSTGTRRDEDRSLSGPIRLILPDRHLAGHAELEVSPAADLHDEHDPWISHTWGTVHAAFDWTTCDGPIAWSFHLEPHETRGSMSLRCDDGSLFAATVIEERSEDETPDHGYRVVLALKDGSYVAG